MKIGDDDVFPPFREKVTTKQSWLEDQFTNVWNRFILFLVDVLIYISLSIPWLAAKIGVGKQDEFDSYFRSSRIPRTGDGKKKPKSKPWKQNKPPSLLARASSQLKSLKPRPVIFPVRMRVEQLYSPRLKQYSVKLKS